MSGNGERGLLANLPDKSDCPDFNVEDLLTQSYEKCGCFFCSNLNGEAVSFAFDNRCICSVGHCVTKLIIKEYNSIGEIIRVDLKLYRIARPRIGILGKVRFLEEQE